jgi:hypothetical protein
VSHWAKNNETYFSHLKFACVVGLSLFLRGVVFFIHGVFPVFSVPKFLNLDATMNKTHEWLRYTEERKKR